MLINSPDYAHSERRVRDVLSAFPENQLLILVTCTSLDDERRVVAARRIREGEKKEDLAKAIAASLQ